MKEGIEYTKYQESRAVARLLIGGGGCIFICSVLPDGFLL